MFGVVEKAAVQLTCRHPFFIEFLYAFKYVETLKIPTAATDGRSLLVNPDWSNGEKVEVHLFMLLHEICHVMLSHHLRRNDRDMRVWLAACDYEVNSLLARCGVAFDKKRWLYEEKFDNESAELIYKELMAEEKIRNAVTTGGDAKLPGEPKSEHTLDNVVKDIIEPGLATDHERSSEEEHVRNLIARAVELGKGTGVPPALAKFVVDATRTPSEPWYNNLQRYMQNITYDQYTWQRINRRALYTHGIIAPALHNEVLGHCVLFVDTSGSCFDQATQSNFCSHFNAIMGEAKPSRLTVLYFDTEVRAVEEFYAGESDVQLKPEGGGWTDFRKLFTYMEEHSLTPEITIVLTDLEGPVPDDPGIPVIWAITTDVVAPFGESLYIK